MKKFRLLLTVVLAVTMVFSLTGCDLFGEGGNDSNLPEIPGVDIDYEIEHFVESGFNTHTIEVGEGHTPLAANWTQVGGKCYTTDESVVEVAKNGNVFGRGVGTAYVVITGIGGTYEIYKYKVEDKVEDKVVVS